MQAEAIACDSCGRECASACGTRHFRTCCFNYLRKRSSIPPLEHQEPPPGLKLELWLAKSQLARNYLNSLSGNDIGDWRHIEFEPIPDSPHWREKEMKGSDDNTDILGHKTTGQETSSSDNGHMQLIYDSKK